MRRRRRLSLATWVPAPAKAVKTILEVACVGQEDTVCDLGCGDGRILVAAVKRFGGRSAIGYEIKKDLCDVSRQEVQRQDLQQRIAICQENLLTADVSKASVITVYLSTRANELLRRKLEMEASPGTRVVTYGFPMRKWRPKSQVQVFDRRFGDFRSVYLYVVPEAFT